MDPLYLALSFFRKKKYEECVKVCLERLEKNPYDQVTFSFKVFKTLTLSVVFFNA